MLHRGLPAALALCGLLAGGAASAGDQPQVRLGIDILWGGHGPVYVAPPPVAWQPPPVYYVPHWAPPGRGYARGYRQGYEQGYDRAGWHRDDHRRHRHGRGRGHGHDD